MFTQINHNSLWHSLSEHQQHCVKRGLPIKYLGASLTRDPLRFVDYEIPKGFAPITVSGIKQMRWANALKSNMAQAQYPTGVIGLHSAPTDYSAFRVAGSIFEMAMHRGLSSWCLSGTAIKDVKHRELPHGDVIVIHGITDDIPSSYMWPIRDFIRSKSTSLVMVVMTSTEVGGGLKMQRDTLRMKEVDVMLCLEDTNEDTSVRFS